MAMAAAVCGETLNTDDRLDQIENLLAKLEFLNVSTSYDSEDDEDYGDDGDDGEALPYDGEDNEDDGEKDDGNGDDGADVLTQMTEMTKSHGITGRHALVHFVGKMKMKMMVKIVLLC